MKTRINHHELVYYVQSQGKAAREGRQIAKRLKDLLPMRLKALKNEWRRGHSAGRAERHALVDRRFMGHIDELVAIIGSATESRVQFETHNMLIKARQSLRGAGPLVR